MPTLPLLNDTIECGCSDCVTACHRKPGWFLPEEIKPAADLLGLTEQEFFDQYLSVDYYGYPSGGFKFVLSPATENSEPGKEFPFDPLGCCVFLKDEKCTIHAAKPFECKYYDHRIEAKKEEHEAVADAWLPQHQKIVELLGREPVVQEPDMLEAMLLLGKMMELGIMPAMKLSKTEELK